MSAREEQEDGEVHLAEPEAKIPPTEPGESHLHSPCVPFSLLL